MTITAPLHVRCDALPGSIASARREVADYASRAGATRRSRDAVNLAVSEAVANAVVHAFPNGAVAGSVVVSAEVLADGRMAVVVGDDGCGMPPNETRDGLGLGLALIAQLAERVELTSDNGGGTSISMVFVLDD